MNTDAIRYDRIKALREEHGYTLRYVAGKIGVTESTAQRHENGRGIKKSPHAGDWIETQISHKKRPRL